MSAAAVPARFLALGDSYTIGEGVAGESSWPMQLARLLRQRGAHIHDAEIVAQTGWTTDELTQAMDAHRFKPPYALVTLSIGVNNQYRGRSADDYADQFPTLLERAIAFAGERIGRVLTVSIPDWGVTRFGRDSGRDTSQVALEIDAFNRAAANACTLRGVAFIDVTGVSRRAGDDAAMLVADGLHPSAAQYAQWTALIAGQVSPPP